MRVFCWTAVSTGSILGFRSAALTATGDRVFPALSCAALSEAKLRKWSPTITSVHETPSGSDGTGRRKSKSNQDCKGTCIAFTMQGVLPLNMRVQTFVCTGFHSFQLVIRQDTR